MEKKNWYAVLCIDRYSSSESDIQRAYRRQALILHPDRNPDDPNASSKFLELKEAYGNSLLSCCFPFSFPFFPECLGDAKRRIEYDRFILGEEIDCVKGLKCVIEVRKIKKKEPFFFPCPCCLGSRRFGAASELETHFTRGKELFVANAISAGGVEDW
jgi:hypothetical protein